MKKKVLDVFFVTFHMVTVLLVHMESIMRFLWPMDFSTESLYVLHVLLVLLALLIAPYIVQACVKNYKFNDRGMVTALTVFDLLLCLNAVILVLLVIIYDFLIYDFSNIVNAAFILAINATIILLRFGDIMWKNKKSDFRIKEVFKDKDRIISDVVFVAFHMIAVLIAESMSFLTWKIFGTERLPIAVVMSLVALILLVLPYIVQMRMKKHEFNDSGTNTALLVFDILACILPCLSMIADSDSHILSRVMVFAISAVIILLRVVSIELQKRKLS